jgi:hypothetical protein
VSTRATEADATCADGTDVALVEAVPDAAPAVETAADAVAAVLAKAPLGSANPYATAKRARLKTVAKTAIFLFRVLISSKPLLSGAVPQRRPCNSAGVVEASTLVDAWDATRLGISHL